MTAPLVANDLSFYGFLAWLVAGLGLGLGWAVANALVAAVLRRRGP